MFTLRQKSLLHGLLGLVVLFVGVANSFTIAVDDDGNENTPPIVVQLALVAQKKTFVVTREQATYRLTECDCGKPVEHTVAYLEHQPATSPGKRAPEVPAPIRT